MTPLLTPNICSLSDGNISASDRFQLCVSSRSGYGLGKHYLRVCKCTCSCPCCALNVVVTAHVSIQAHWRVYDWMDIIKMDLIGVERKGVDSSSDSIADCCEEGDEHSVPLKRRKFLSG
jgi:hypothetical protein